MYQQYRQQMVNNLVKEAGITDEGVINAMLAVPRHQFVDGPLQQQAYSGKALPIGFGQTISHPTTVAVMSSLLRVSSGSKVLEIGTGSGYQAAVLAAMGAQVITVERIRELAVKARHRLEALGYYQVAVIFGDGSLGYPPRSPYDGIIVTAASPTIPEALLKQLNEGGRLLVPVGTLEQQDLWIIEKKNGKYLEQVVENFKFVPLRGRKGWQL